MMIIARPLEATEVTFTVTTEVEQHTSPEESFDDPDAASEIQRRLDAGHDEAWCTVIVTAEWNGWKGVDSLGCCSLSTTYTALVAADEHDMHQTALDNLNAIVAHDVAQLAPLLVPRGGGQ
jgi:hypothetical protein